MMSFVVLIIGYTCTG